MLSALSNIVDNLAEGIYKINGEYSMKYWKEDFYSHLNIEDITNAD